MEHKKEMPKLSRKRRESTDLFAEEPAASSNINASIRPISTPVRINNPSEDEESPYFPCSTQEMAEGVDVLWDWNSPQSKPKTFTRKSRKKLNLQHSPKVPLRRHPSNNNEQIIQDFNKIREELRALKAEIAKPDHEESLVLSPREEEAFKREENEKHMHDFDHNIIEEHQPPDEENFHDPFDDDMDEQLIIFSQKIEKTMQNTENKVNIDNLNIVSAKVGSSSTAMESNTSKSINSNIHHTWNKYSSSLPKITKNNCGVRPTVGKSGDKKLLSVMSENSKINAKNEQVIALQDSETSVFNDSFDNVLSQMGDDDLDQLTQVVDIKQYKNGNKDLKIDEKSKVFPRSQSEDIIITGTVQMTGRKVEWHRTQSFENYNTQLSKEKLQEIERKRLEAKAKRDAKKNQDTNIPIITEVPETITCSQDEIQKKRLQALEKLEAKRLQDIIEKKKQEALKRREENRKKNAANVKSSLTTRL